MYKQFVTAQGDKVTITVPEALAGKKLKVTVEEAVITTDRKKLLAEAEAFFNRVSVSTKGFKFNRDEANAR